MIELDNQTCIEIDFEILEKIWDSSKVLELIIVDSETMRKINLEQRGVDRTTDVLSFPFEDIPNLPRGSILINSDIAVQKAKELGHSCEDEITLMFIHGCLHVKGYDHERDDGEMREQERGIIKKFQLPESLIVRVEG